MVVAIPARWVANVPAVKMGKEVGLDKVIQICRTLGIKSPIEPVVSLPLGAVGVTPLEMAGAFATFASNGWQSETTTILRVTDSDGNNVTVFDLLIGKHHLWWMLKSKRETNTRLSWKKLQNEGVMTYVSQNLLPRIARILKKFGSGQDEVIYGKVYTW